MSGLQRWTRGARPEVMGFDACVRSRLGELGGGHEGGYARCLSRSLHFRIVFLSQGCDVFIACSRVGIHISNSLALTH